MRSLNLQNMRCMCASGPLATGYNLSWVYAGGATYASPVTVWSENTGDANNNLVLKYNGTTAWLEKKIAGVITYVAVYKQLAAGTYKVKILLNADNTINLVVDGSASQSGYGAELITNPGFTGGTTGWNTMPTGWTYGTNNLVATNAATGVIVNQDISAANTYKLMRGVINIVAANNTGGAGIGLVFGGTLIGGVLSGTGVKTVYGMCNQAAITVGFRAAGAVLVSATVDDVSFQLIHNNTDTTAIPWVTVL